MQIVLKGANFGKNNVGHTPIDVEYEKETQTVIKALTSVLTDEDKAKLDILIFSLKKADLWDKIKVLLLPSLFHSIQDAYLNVKTGIRMEITNGEKIIFTDGKGLNFGSYTIGDIIPSLLYTGDGIKTDNCHIGFYNTEPEDNDTLKSRFMLNVSDDLKMGRRCVEGGLVGTFMVGSSRLNFDPNTTYSTGLVCGSFNKETLSHIVINNGIVSTKEVEQPINGREVQKIDFGYGNTISESGVFYPTNSQIGFYTIGYSMTSEELIALDAIIEELMN